MSSVFKRGNAEVEANLTPMIDVTFLLIVFFVLVSQIVDVENVKNMQLPEPTEPATMMPGEEKRAVINVLPGAAGGCDGYRLGTHTYQRGPEGLERLAGHLAGLFSVNPQIAVNLRADRGTHYEHVEPAMQAVADAAARVVEVDVAPRVNLVVIRNEQP